MDKLVEPEHQTINHISIPHTWTLVGPIGVLVSIDLRNGNITYGPNYTPDEAARVFWEAIGHFRRKQCP